MIVNFAIFKFCLVFHLLNNHVPIIDALNVLFCVVQVVYAVANEASRLEIPEGPLGRLISG